MKPWLRRGIGVLTLGGSFVGVVLVLQWLFGTTQSALGISFLLAFGAVYAWGAWVGMRLLEQAPRTLYPASLFWLLQVPYCMSPLVGYLLTSGGMCVASYTIGQGAGLSWQLGSKFEYSLLQTDKPWSFGINVFALAIALVLLYRSHRESLEADAAPADATGDVAAGI